MKRSDEEIEQLIKLRRLIRGEPIRTRYVKQPGFWSSFFYKMRARKYGRRQGNANIPFKVIEWSIYSMLVVMELIVEMLVSELLKGRMKRKRLRRPRW